MSPELIKEYEIDIAKEKAEPVREIMTNRQTTKRASSNESKTRMVTLGEWDNQVSAVTNVERNAKGDLVIHLQWKDGKQSIHPSVVANKACPMQVIRFYEERLRFFPTADVEQENEDNIDASAEAESVNEDGEGNGEGEIVQ